MTRKSLYSFVVLSILFISIAWGQGTYYDNISTSSPTFISDLQTLISSPYNRITYDNYQNTMIPYYESYVVSSTQRAVTCVYSSDVDTYTPPFTWGYFSREHTWCQSWMPGGPVTSAPYYSDQHHLFPVNQNDANDLRSNHPLGKVVNVTKTFLDCKLGTDSSGITVFEPRDRQKGDSARALLYMAVRYNGQSGLDWTFSALSTYLVTHSEGPESVEQLIQWHEQDPPDKWEVDRNTYVQSTQLNRNPFVDHPEYVNYINFWNLTALNPVFAAEPTNSVTNFGAGVVTNSSIQLTWTNATGAQLPSGYLLIGYNFDDYIIPMDGITYSDSSNLSTGTTLINISYPTNSYTFTGLNPGSPYYFRIYSYNGTGTTINYLINGTIPSAVVTTSIGTLATEPTNYATNFSIYSVSNSSLSLSWTDATGAQTPSGYLLLANNNDSFTDPIDGLTYSDSSNLANGSAVINISYPSSGAFTFSGLSSNTNYYFKLYSYNGLTTQTNYKTDGTVPYASGITQLSPNVITFDPTNITVSSATGNAQIVYLGVPNPTQHGFVWDTATGPTTALATKTQDGSVSSTVFYTSSITGLSPQTYYYLRAYATNTVGTSYGNEVNFYTLANEPANQVTLFSATAISQSQINLSWTTTASSGYLILQKTGSSPTGTPTDGNEYGVGDSVGDAQVAAVVTNGSSSTQGITGLSSGTLYYFSIMPYNYDGTNPDTYNYNTTPVIPTCFATTSFIPVIVNEFSQGTSGAKEWVELLVAQNNFNLQGYKMTDGNGSLSITLSGSGFSNMAAGSLIVLYNGGDVDTGITPDLSYDGTTDFTLVISSLNTTGTYALTRTTGWSGTSGAFANSGNTSDGPQLYDSSNNQVFLFPSSAYPGAQQYSAYTGNTISGATVGSNWVVGTDATGATPDQPNGGANTTWINSLRGLTPVELWNFEATETEK